ncbi:MAG: NAD(P)H-dependent oxidoreductase [Chitinophagaceae bacterium]|nr:NAD(P)H-dependent oxidoreductase [Chitinophagaceae bacterium]
MQAPEQSFLGISGSIRPGASSTLLLQWIGEQLSRQHSFVYFDGLAAIPPFDGTEPVPPLVEMLISQIRAAHCVIFCSPEYAHGISGVLKNALDWTVASDVWIDKPVAIITAAGQGEHAHASLIEILTTMSAVVLKEASILIGFIKSKMDKNGNITDRTAEALLHQVIEVLSQGF